MYYVTLICNAYKYPHHKNAKKSTKERRPADHTHIQYIYTHLRSNSAKMDSNNVESSSYEKKGSVLPKDREHVSTMVGKKIAEVGGKAVKSAVNAVKKHNDKGKVNPA
ncbi:hypothetical protein CDL12_10857 [Handroanthus impetiginosus]|uniref:Uncharacterized protein n=1 Tax=Handroanthus impetiginosus TaxID=429701 RepID=A0A2G9HG28_9LAMI|nr:hypothetical protein CDL12_10857 [Handroanthus impetiginosus]